MIEPVTTNAADTAMPAGTSETLAPDVEPGGGPEDAPDPHAARLLLVSADEKVAPNMLAIAQAVGFDCDICAFAHAMSLLKGGTYHAAMVDIGTDSKIGLALVGEARGMTTARQVPIVALVDPREVNLAFRAGASFTVTRPVSSDLLRNTLAAIYRVAVGLRRQYARYRVEVPLTLTQQGKAVEAKATDFGSGGFALVAMEPLTCGSVMSVKFVLPGSEEQIVAMGEIRWADPRGRAGFCFTSIAGTGRASLENWMARRNAGIEHPESSRVPAAPRPRQAMTADAAANPTRRSARRMLTFLLIAYCLFMIGFWIYVASTS
ncbi:MAG: PilZ domain-containing protein [Terriglobales bacterium]